MGLLHDLIWGKPVNGGEGSGGGSSDFSTAEVTVRYSENENLVDGITALALDTIDNVWTVLGLTASSGTETYQIVVPQSGFCIYENDGALGNASGNIYYDSEKAMYIILGDCTVEVHRL